MIRRISIFLTSVCFLANIGPAQTTAKYRSTDIYEFSRQIADISKDGIWPGYDFRRYTRSGSDSGNGYLYFSSAPDDKGPDVFVWRLTDEYFQDHSLEEDLVITFHEAFHAFESDPNRKGGKWGAENAMLLFEYQESSARSGALFNIEARILHQALQSKSKNDLKEKVRQFLGVRRLRQSEIDPRFVEFEKGAELNEGLAEYAGTKAVVLAIKAAEKKRISIPFVDPTVETFLNKKYEMLDAITKVGQNIRRKFYYTGSVQGFLLDRLMPDWKAKVQIEGASLQDLLAVRVGKLPPPTDVNSFLAKYGYEKILGEEENAVAARRANNQMLLENTLGQKGRKYTIDYSALSNRVGIRTFDPMNVTMITPKLRIHTRNVTFAAEDVFTATFAQPVVEDLDNRQYTTVIPASQSESLKIDGVDIDLTRPLKTAFHKNLSINTAKFRFEAKSGSLEISGGEIHIVLKDP
jgi:hypothetical protein